MLGCRGLLLKFAMERNELSNVVEFRSLRPISTEGLLDSRLMSPKRDSSTGASGAICPLPDMLSTGSLASSTGRGFLFGGLPLRFFTTGCALAITPSSASLTLRKSTYASLELGGISAISTASCEAWLGRGLGAEGATFSRLGRGIVGKVCVVLQIPN
jgi:hypothetical protein